MRHLSCLFQSKLILTGCLKTVQSLGLVGIDLIQADFSLWTSSGPRAPCVEGWSLGLGGERHTLRTQANRAFVPFELWRDILALQGLCV